MIETPVFLNDNNFLEEIYGTMYKLKYVCVYVHIEFNETMTEYM